jgi:hypothetical protein
MGMTLDDIHFDMYRRGVKRCGSHKAYMKTLPKQVRQRMEDTVRKTHCERHYGMQCWQIAVTVVIVCVVATLIIINL